MRIGTRAFMSLANDIEQALPTQRPRPQPYLPRMRIAAHREENNLGLADQVLERHVSDAAGRRRNAAVERIITVVAHHEIMIRRHDIDPCVVDLGTLDTVERIIADAVRQRLMPALDMDRLKPFAIDIVFGALALDGLAVD